MSIFGELTSLRLLTRNKSASTGLLRLDGPSGPHLRAAIGSKGLTTHKKEGDGKTPIGRFNARRILYRADKLARPYSHLPTQKISKQNGWCDKPGDRNYNRPVNLPYAASAEQLFRDDEIYDLIVVLNHNQLPRIQGAGSAIFMHVARPDFSPTEGCVALACKDLIELVKHLTPTTEFRFGC